MKKKYKISVPVDYVQGCAEYGHFEMVVETEDEITEEDAKKLASNISRDGHLIVDGVSIDDYGDLDFSEIYFEEIK